MSSVSNVAGNRAISRIAQLHISHSWGGGIGRWIADFCKADSDRHNLVLQSVSDRNAAAIRLELLDPLQSNQALAEWTLAAPIRATDVRNSEYAQILREILDGFGVDVVLVSSLIGHSFEALATGLSTVLIAHDMYPFCPALFACFGEPCTSCEPDKLARCMAQNPYNEFWHNTAPVHWIALREAYLEVANLSNVRLVAPSLSVRDRLCAVLPQLHPNAWKVIAHGLDTDLFARPSVQPGDPKAPARLRIVIPGRLPPHKGLYLLRDALPALLGSATLLLLGCGKFGEPFRGVPGVEVVPDYEYSRLGEAVRQFDPDMALLLSVLPESFSYTLSEMFALGLPVVATKVGALPERIQDGHNGLLFAPDSRSLVDTVTLLATDRPRLLGLRQQVQASIPRRIEDMVSDYHALFPESHRPAATADPSLLRSTLLRWLTKLSGERQQLQLENARLADAVRQAVFRADDLAARNRELELLRENLSRDVLRLAFDKEAIYLSRSWRLTAPLRFVTSLLSRDLSPNTTPQAIDLTESPKQSQLLGDGLLSGLPIAIDADACKAARLRLRYEIGVPDAARVVVAILADADLQDAKCFLEMASAILDARNDTVFAVFRALRPDVGSGRLAQAILTATRKLFVLDEKQHAFAIDGADVVLVGSSFIQNVSQIEAVATSARKVIVLDSAFSPALSAAPDSVPVFANSEATFIAAVILNWFGSGGYGGCA